MRPIYEATVAQIDVTNACHLSCANCTRHVGHHRPSYFMSLEQVREAIRSLADFPGRIGLMGGEVFLHPQIREILAIFREEIPDKKRRELWTAGWRWLEFLDDITETFEPDLIAYNDHTQHTGKHQPLLVAIDEVVEDKDLRDELIDACWVQAQWSPAITDRGAYFCEVAASLGQIFGIDGWPVEPGWWDKTPDQFRDQVEQFCGMCSAALPMPAYSDGRGGRDGPTYDVVSPGMLEKLKAAGSPKALRGHVVVWQRKIGREDLAELSEWSPSHFRDFVAHAPEDVDAHLRSA